MTHRNNARVAGAAFLLYIGVGIAQMVLSGALRADGTAARLALIARHSARVQTNVVLSLGICVIALVLATALHALTRAQDPELALLALLFRAGEGVLTVVTPLASLGLLWAATRGADAPGVLALAELLFQARAWNVLLTATLFALGSTLFSWLLLRGRVIPPGLAWVGLGASVLLVVGLPLQLVGLLHGPVTQLIWIPMAVFEIPVGIWLLVKGVRPAAAG